MRRGNPEKTIQLSVFIVVVANNSHWSPVIGSVETAPPNVMPAQAGIQTTDADQRQQALDPPIKPENDGNRVLFVVVVIVFRSSLKTR